MPNVVQEKLRQAIRDDPSFKCRTAEQVSSFLCDFATHSRS